MRAVIGHSDEVDTRDAVEDVLAQCRSQLQGERPKAALVFMSVDYDHHKALAAIRNEWEDLPLVGASSDGEFSSRFGFAMDSILITLLCGDGFEATVGLGRNLSADIEAAVEDAVATGCGSKAPAVALTTFAPSTNASEVIRKLNSRIDLASCPVLGGLSGDHREFSRMKEFCGEEVLSDSLPILFLHGSISVSWGVASGWTPVGREHTVTRSDGHIVHEIDGKPALETYKLHYGEVNDGNLGEYPLAVYSNGMDGPWTLRAAMGSNPETGELRFAGEVPEGDTVRMTEVVPDGILSGTLSSISDALDRFGGTHPQVALLFSCAARKWVLGSKAEDEVKEVQKALQKRKFADLALSGLYVYGEIAPPQNETASAFHNETCVAVLLGTD